MHVWRQLLALILTGTFAFSGTAAFAKWEFTIAPFKLGEPIYLMYSELTSDNNFSEISVTCNNNFSDNLSISANFIQYRDPQDDMFVRFQVDDNQIQKIAGFISIVGDPPTSYFNATSNSISDPERAIPAIIEEMRAGSRLYMVSGSTNKRVVNIDLDGFAEAYGEFASRCDLS